MRKSISLLQHELLHALADDVARVDVPRGVERETVNPVELARLFLAIRALGHGPELEELAFGAALHEELVLGRAAEDRVRFPPGHRRWAADPDLVLLRHPEAPGDDQVSPFGEEFALLVED